MAFYLRPSTGHVSLQKLHTFAVNRLEFLLKVHRAGGDRLRLLDITNSIQTVADSDCLIEGTQKDNISHFILRLLFVADQETTDFFLQAETQLFQFRFSCLTEKEIYRLLKSTTKHVPTIEQPCAATYHETDIRHVLSILQAIKQPAGTWQNVAHQYMTGRSGQCFHLPFQAVTSLVSSRMVVLHRGMAEVHYDNLDEVLTGVFRTKVSIPLNWNNLSCLAHDQVDQLEHLFPLCMSSLHKALRTNHRLKHNDRVQYSLFLKEAGMPVHQAIKMWKQEYSQPSHLPGTGLHTWQADERRYKYNIRHMYGLEGARRNYRGHCCASLQRRQLGPAEQGGCPFVHFDNHHLGNLLTDAGMMEVDQADILNLKSTGDPCGACAVYLRHRIASCLDQQGVNGRRDRRVQGHPPPVNQTLRHSEYRDADREHMPNTSDQDGGNRIQTPGQDGGNRIQAPGQDGGNRIQTPGQDGGNRIQAPGQDGGNRIQAPGQDGVACSDGEVARQDDVVLEDGKTDGPDCDVILVSIHTKQRGVKRSLSTRSERVKRHVVWYESGKLTLQEDKAVMETDAGRATTGRSSMSEEHEQDFVHKHPPEHVCSSNLNPHGAGESSKCDTSVSSAAAASCPLPSRQADATVTHEDTGSCFEHHVCPSQTESNTQMEKLDKVRGRLRHLSDFHIHKPVDFYTCFKELVEGLKSGVKEC